MYSKSLKKATDDVKLLSMEIMQNEVSGVMDIDTFCDINGEWFNRNKRKIKLKNYETKNL